MIKNSEMKALIYQSKDQKEMINNNNFKGKIKSEIEKIEKT